MKTAEFDSKNVMFKDESFKELSKDFRITIYVYF